MQALAFWKAATSDHANLIESLLAWLREHGIRYCVVDGTAVNAYVEPLVSLDLDLVVAVDQLESVAAALPQNFRVERFPHSLNLALAGSQLRAQIQTDPRYFSFVDRAALREVLGVTLPVACVDQDRVCPRRRKHTVRGFVTAFGHRLQIHARKTRHRIPRGCLGVIRRTHYGPYVRHALRVCHRVPP